MRLYNRNITRKKFGEVRRQTVPDRDAVVWSVDTNNYYALVKIQGSPNTVKAHYPRNWVTVPSWLKPGNAVRIRHRSGVQGYIEVDGHGRAIPSPVEGDALPTPNELPDGIVSGMEILESSVGGMNITINDGTYRIDGTTYVYTADVTGYIVMDDPPPMVMGSGTKLGFGEYITPVAIDAAPAVGYGRYDALVIGTDGTVDVVKGTATNLNSEPAEPNTPTDHVLIGYLFIYGGMTSIPQDAIGVKWTQPKPNTVVPSSAIMGDNWIFEMPWDAGDDYPIATITLSIKDQYGVSRSISGDATATILSGTGTISLDGSTYDTSVSKTISSSATLYYKRNQTVSEQHVLIQVDYENYPSLSSLVVITLLDSGGDPI